MITPRDRIVEYFSDALCEAEEFIKDGQMTPDEVVTCFADALNEWHSYFQNTADIYEKLINAVISRYRNK
jgi:hypothetical protein